MDVKRRSGYFVLGIVPRKVTSQLAVRASSGGDGVDLGALRARSQGSKLSADASVSADTLSHIQCPSPLHIPLQLLNTLHIRACSDLELRNTMALLLGPQLQSHSSSTCYGLFFQITGYKPPV